MLTHPCDRIIFSPKNCNRVLTYTHELPMSHGSQNWFWLFHIGLSVEVTLLSNFTITITTRIITNCKSPAYFNSIFHHLRYLHMENYKMTLEMRTIVLDNAFEQLFVKAFGNLSSFVVNPSLLPILVYRFHGLF